MSAAATCDFASIADPLDEALRTRFISSVNNEAVLTALFKMKADELDVTTAVQVAIQTEDATKVEGDGLRPNIRSGVGDCAETVLTTANAARSIFIQRRANHIFFDAAASLFFAGGDPSIAIYLMPLQAYSSLKQLPAVFLAGTAPTIAFYLTLLEAYFCLTQHPAFLDQA